MSQRKCVGKYFPPTRKPLQQTFQQTMENMSAIMYPHTRETLWKTFSNRQGEIVTTDINYFRKHFPHARETCETQFNINITSTFLHSSLDSWKILEKIKIIRKKSKKITLIIYIIWQIRIKYGKNKFTPPMFFSKAFWNLSSGRTVSAGLILWYWKS